MTTTFKPTITITRNSADEIIIRVRCESSRNEFVEVRMTPHALGMALTGLSSVECETGLLRNPEVVGMRKIIEPRQAIYPMDSRNREQMQQWLIDNKQEDGWTLDTYLGSQNSIKHLHDGSGYVLKYRVFKYVNDVEPRQDRIDPEDPIYKAAKESVIASQNGSTARLARIFSVSIDRASGMMVQMEREGIVSGFDTMGLRTVLVSQQDEAADGGKA